MHEPAVTAAELTRRIAERSARVGIIGQGYVGLPLAVEFARVGFSVTGFDTSLDHVTTLNAGRSHTPDVPDEALRARLDAGRYQATTDLFGKVGQQLSEIRGHVFHRACITFQGVEQRFDLGPVMSFVLEFPNARRYRANDRSCE